MRRVGVEHSVICSEDNLYPRFQSIQTDSHGPVREFQGRQPFFRTYPVAVPRVIHVGYIEISQGTLPTETRGIPSPRFESL